MKNESVEERSKEDNEPVDEYLLNQQEIAIGMILLNGVIFRPREKPL